MAKGDFTKTVRMHNFGPMDRGGQPLRIIIGTITATGTYDNTNGIALDLTDYITDVRGVWVEAKAGYITEYDRTANQFNVYYFDYNAVADGPAIKVADTTDITTPYVGVAFMAWGY